MKKESTERTPTYINDIQQAFIDEYVSYTICKYYTYKQSGNVPEILFDVGVHGSQIDDLGMCHKDGVLNSPQFEKLGIEFVYVLIQIVYSKVP